MGVLRLSGQTSIFGVVSLEMRDKETQQKINNYLGAIIGLFVICHEMARPAVKYMCCFCFALIHTYDTVPFVILYNAMFCNATCS